MPIGILKIWGITESLHNVSAVSVVVSDRPFKYFYRTTKSQRAVGTWKEYVATAAICCNHKWYNKWQSGQNFG